jgi:hypothetical protein
MTDVTIEVSEEQCERDEQSEWSAPSIDEQSACAEICAYVFTA